MPLLVKALPYIIGLAALIGLYAYGDHHGHAVAEAAWQARWTARDLAETQARDRALSAQKAAQDATDARNATIIGRLSDVAKERDNALLDAQFSRRLLSAARAAAPSGAVPPASDQPGAAEAGATGGAEGAGRLSGLVADFRTECRLNADDWDALQAELAPQLTSAVPR